jgi:TPR repeat protein
MYRKGQGVPQDYLQAHMWVNLAASASQGETNEIYAKLRKLIAEKMTSEQIAEAQRLAREWKPKTWGELKKRLKE